MVLYWKLSQFLIHILLIQSPPLSKWQLEFNFLMKTVGNQSKATISDLVTQIPCRSSSLMVKTISRNNLVSQPGLHSNSDILWYNSNLLNEITLHICIVYSNLMLMLVVQACDSIQLRGWDRKVVV